MRLDDIKVYIQTEEKLNVVATFGATAYQFSHNEVMEDWMIGNYSGHAVYIIPKD